MYRSSIVAALPVLLLSLAACGGGGAGDTTSPPTVSAPPPPPPPPLEPDPPLVDYNTAEYRAEYGLSRINALDAYEAGLSGSGVTVGVVDTGIDRDNPEFSGAISPLSTNIITGDDSTLQDPDGHGTAVAGIIAARRNGAGTHGVAFNAGILAIRADREGGCGEECTYYDRDVADSVDYAVANGARVINLSMGGDNGPSAQLQRALIDAVDAGVAVVISAGNDEDDTPSPFASFAADPRVRGGIIIAGASTPENTLASFSNKAGAAGGTREVYAVAPGQDIRVVGLDGEPGMIFVGSGTSYAAPHVVGAIALLMQNFPNLTAQEIIAILLDTAQDLGAEGNDALYGRGLIDLAAALQPIGTLEVATATGEIVPLEGALMPGTAMGDSLNAGLAGALTFDARDRAYEADLDRRLAAAPGNFTLRSAARNLRYRAASTYLGRPTLHVGFAVDSMAFQPAESSLERHAGDRMPRPHIRFQAPLGDALSLGLTSGPTVGHAAGSAGGLALTAKGADPASQIAGWGESARLSYALDARTVIGSRIFSGTRDAGAEFDDLQQHGAGLFLSHALARQATLRLEAGEMQESGSVLGMTGSGVFDGFEAARTRYMQVGGELRLAGFSLSGNYAASRTEADLNETGIFGDMSSLHADSWSLTLVDARFARRGHRWGLHVAEPLAVNRGSAALHLATGWADGAPVIETRRIDLAAPAREKSLELFHRYQGPGALAIQSNFIYRTNPDNLAVSADEAAVFLEISTPL